MNAIAKAISFWGICVALALSSGCRSDTPKNSTTRTDFSTVMLTRLTSPKEVERFKVLQEAQSHAADFNHADLENALTALRPKNVSTLIYVYLQTRNKALYDLSPAATMALENADGAFPNIAYYYARVQPESGVQKLYQLYQRSPEKKLPICLALGEAPDKNAHQFLVSEAKTIKSTGGEIINQLSGLKNVLKPMPSAMLFWFLEQNLNREELIILSELDIPITDDQLKTLWQSKGIKREFAIQYTLKDPDGCFNSLKWIIAQYLEAGDTQSVKRILFSDSMRAAVAPRVTQFREAMLNTIHVDAE